MGKNPVVAVIAVIILIVAVVLIIKGMGSDTGPTGQGTWYDTGSGTLYGGPSGVQPPAPAPSGKDGVLASVFSKGTCENKADRFIGFLSKFTDEGKTLLADAGEERPVDIAKMQSITNEHKLVKREKDTEWVAFGTEEGQAIVAETKAKGTRLCPTHLD